MEESQRDSNSLTNKQNVPEALGYFVDKGKIRKYQLILFP